MVDSPVMCIQSSSSICAVLCWICPPLWTITAGWMCRRPLTVCVCAGGSVKMTPASKTKRLMTLMGGADNKEKVTHSLWFVVLLQCIVDDQQRIQWTKGYFAQQRYLYAFLNSVVEKNDCVIQHCLLLTC